jgi:membrane protein YdbS with pleckstrin-like domain
MAFPRKLLIPGERLVLELRPHFIAVALPTVVAVLATFVAVWLTLGNDTFDHGAARAIVWVAWLVFMLAYPVRRYIWWLTSNFVVTSSRVIHREGFIAKRSMEIPLDKINDVRFEQNIFDRVVGAGTLVIQSASESGRNEFSFIRHPEEVQRTIYQLGEADQHQTLRSAVTGEAPPSVPMASQPPTPAPPHVAAPPGAPSSVTELERLADLRARGVLTQEEFEAQKAKILGQG